MGLKSNKTKKSTFDFKKRPKLQAIFNSTQRQQRSDGFMNFTRLDTGEDSINISTP